MNTLKKSLFIVIASVCCLSLFNKTSANSLRLNESSLIWDEISNEIFSSFIKNWFYLQVKDLNDLYNWRLDLSSFKDLNLTNDGVFNANKKTLEAINEQQNELGKKIDVILEKIASKEQSIDNVDSQYRRFIEIENDINSADYVYTLALPTNKFLLKEKEEGTNQWSIIITREPTIWNELNNWPVDPELKNVIEREIDDIRTQPSVAAMRDKLIYYTEKHNRNYSPLFIEKNFSDFFNGINISISHKDKKFAQWYTYRNKEYMNSFFYLPQKLKQLQDKTNEYLFVYIPLKASNPSVSNILWWINGNNRTRVFKDSTDFCFKIDYQDNHQLFNKHFCSLNEYFAWWTLKVENVDVHYLNNFTVKLSKLWFMSVIYQILILIWFGIIPFYLIKYVDKIIWFGNKFEVEQL